MHRLAVGALAGFAALAACDLEAKTRLCKNGATCPFDEACTEVALDSGEALCGTPRLIDQCENKANFEACQVDEQGAPGVCLSNVCTACTAELAGCRVPGWNSMTSPTTANLNAVWSRKLADAYAVGDVGTVLHYNGIEWKPETMPTAANLTGVWGTDGKVYAVSTMGEIFASTGDGTWTLAASNPGAKTLFAISGSSASNVVAVGNDGTMLRFDGSTWTPSQVPGISPQALHGVYTTDADHIVVVGNGGAEAHYLSGAWTLDRMPSVSFKNLLAVGGLSASDAYATGLVPTNASVPNVRHFNGGAWGDVFSASGPPAVDFDSVWGVDARVYIGGVTGLLLVYDGTMWTSATIGPVSGNTITGIGGSSVNDLFLVAKTGKIAHSAGL